MRSSLDRREHVARGRLRRGPASRRGSRPATAAARTRPSAASGTRDAAAARSASACTSRRPASAARPRASRRDAVAQRLLADLGVVGVEHQVELGVEQLVLVGDRGGLLDAVGVDQHDADVAQAADAGLRADRRQPGLDPRVTEVALLGLARAPVEVDLLVGAARDAEAPARGRPPGRPARSRPPRACTSRPTGRRRRTRG